MMKVLNCNYFNFKVLVLEDFNLLVCPLGLWYRTAENAAFCKSHHGLYAGNAASEKKALTTKYCRADCMDDIFPDVFQKFNLIIKFVSDF